MTKICQSLNEFSRELIYPLFPIFITKVLGFSILQLGVIEGASEAASILTKRAIERKSEKETHKVLLPLLTLLVSSITRPLFAFFEGIFPISLIRFADKLEGNKSMIAKLLGPLAAFLLLPYLDFNYKKLFLITVIPGAIVAVLIYISIRELPRSVKVDKESEFLQGKKSKTLILPKIFFSLGNPSGSFLMLRAQELGSTTSVLPILWLITNSFLILSSRYGGKTKNKSKTFLIGIFLRSIAYISFTFIPFDSHLWLPFALYGTAMGLTEIPGGKSYFESKRDKTNRIPPYLPPLAEGLTPIIANSFIGFLWNWWSSFLAFMICAGLNLIALGLLFLLTPSDNS